MPIVPAQSTLTQFDDLAVTLPRYAQLIQVTECSIWGVQNANDEEPGCRDIWLKSQRDEVQRYLAEAQEEIEQQISYPMTRRWFANELHPYRCPTFTNWGHVIEGGIKATITIQAGAAVDHTADPAVIGPLATTVTDVNEIAVFHPGSEVEIIPSAVTIAGGNVTIEIPRCRMVKEAQADNPPEGWDYTDVNNFEATVDVKRIYNDPSTNAVLVWPHQCSVVCAQSGCSEYTHDGCEYVRIPEIGTMDITPATYSGGAWVTSNGLSCCRGTPQFVRLNYRAGVVTTKQMEDAVIRLAHSKMPDEFCGQCETFTRLWRRDRFIPEVLTRERLNNPFGISTGAWVSWTFTRQFRLVRGDVI